MQIGLVVLVGLACKNAILIVEFAKQKHLEGWPRADATREACRLRLRPILMTSFAFIIGVIPLAVAAGAGAEMRRSLGIAVFSGMLGVTLFGIFLTPVFFSVIQGLDRDAGVHAAAVRAGSARLLLGGLGRARDSAYMLARAWRLSRCHRALGRSAARWDVLAALAGPGHSSGCIPASIQASDHSSDTIGDSRIENRHYRAEIIEL